MRKPVSLFAVTALAASLFAGCSTSDINGPERKFGRAINNVTEFARGGEIRRSMEQAAIFRGGDVAYTTGFLHGLNRSIARTGVGVYELVTFPLPNGPGKDFGPIYLPEHPVYPANYKPGILADQMFSPDTSLGFSGGEVMPFLPGSRFRVFDN